MLLLAAWFGLALALASIGQVSAALARQQQPWWPSFGYALAISSCWIVLIPPLLLATQRLQRFGPVLRWSLYLVGWPIATAAHVALFALLFGPLYGSADMGGRIAMIERMAVRNLDTDLFLYVLVLGAGLWSRVSRGVERPALSAIPAAPVVVRERGRTRLVPLAAIDWIGAAGDYAELHLSGGETALASETLTGLARRLPADSYARVHRGTIVKLDRVAGWHPLGRGDAALELHDGTQLRVSRRYRADLPERLGLRGAPAGRTNDPARRPGLETPAAG